MSSHSDTNPTQGPSSVIAPFQRTAFSILNDLMEVVTAERIGMDGSRRYRVTRSVGTVNATSIWEPENHNNAHLVAEWIELVPALHRMNLLDPASDKEIKMIENIDRVSVFVMDPGDYVETEVIGLWKGKMLFRPGSEYDFGAVRQHDPSAISTGAPMINHFKVTLPDGDKERQPTIEETVKERDDVKDDDSLLDARGEEVDVEEWNKYWPKHLPPATDA